MTFSLTNSQQNYVFARVFIDLLSICESNAKPAQRPHINRSLVTVFLERTESISVIILEMKNCEANCIIFNVDVLLFAPKAVHDLTTTQRRHLEVEKMIRPRNGVLYPF